MLLIVHIDQVLDERCFCSSDCLSLLLPFFLYSDPNSRTTFSDYLYSNDGFAKALSSSLNGNGVLVAQVGEGTIPFSLKFCCPRASLHFCSLF